MKPTVQLAVFTSLFLSNFAEATRPVIYGEDHRVEVSEGTLLQKKLARSAATLILDTDILRDPARPGVIQLPQRSLREWLESQSEGNKRPQKLFSSEVTSAAKRGISFCDDVRFLDQPVPGQCSGFLIAPDLLVTAGHCADMYGFCEEFSWVFGFEVDPVTKRAGVDIKDENIYKCKRVVSSALSMPLGLDYAIVQLDRRVQGREPLEIRNDSVVPNNSPVFVVGSPTGLPLKIAAGAKVRDNSHPTFFSANTDTFGGNSGSAIFNAKTGVIEGIMVRGDEDYVPNNDKMCLETKKCEDGGCRGEEVTRMTAIPEVGVQRVLNTAAEMGDIKTVNQILKLDFWIDFYGKDGQSALIKAVRGGKNNTTLALLKRGADINLQDALGNSATHHLARFLSHRFEKVFVTLKNKNANFELRNSLGETPLLSAARNLNLEGAKMLIKSGVSINVVDNKGETILFPFTRNGNMKALKVLISLGVDPGIKNAQGKTIYDLLNSGIAAN